MGRVTAALLDALACCQGRGDTAACQQKDLGEACQGEGRGAPAALSAEAFARGKPSQGTAKRSGEPAAGAAAAAQALRDSDPRLAETVELAEALLPGRRMSVRQRAWCTPDNVARYLRGRRGNAAAAAEILAQALRWRHEHEAILSGAREPRWQTDLRVLARGSAGHPLIYGCFRHNVRVTSENQKDMVEHMAAVMEAAGRERRRGALSADTVMDCHGFRVTDNLNPAPSLALMRMANQPYRDCLRMAIVVDAPRGFQLLWRVAEPLLSAETRRKIHFASREQAVRLIAERSGAEAAEVVDRVMRLNRGPGGCKPGQLPSELAGADEGEEAPAEEQPRSLRLLSRAITRKFTRAASQALSRATSKQGQRRGLLCCRRRKNS